MFLDVNMLILQIIALYNKNKYQASALKKSKKTLTLKADCKEVKNQQAKRTNNRAGVG